VNRVSREPISQPQQDADSPKARFAALVEPHYEVLHRVAYRLSRSAHDAEDLAQEVCVRAFSRLDELELLEQPRGWLLRVLYRLFVDSVRRYERKHVGSIDDLTTELVSEEPSPLQEAERMLMGRRLDEAWRHLDAEQQALLVLHEVEGHTLAELMELTGLKEGTLKSRLHRARVRLGKLLERESPAGAQPQDARNPS
jgi:RNA polymerase sigma factor (sigma-70 family)